MGSKYEQSMALVLKDVLNQTSVSSYKYINYRQQELGKHTEVQTASKYRVKVGMPGEAFEREHV